MRLSKCIKHFAVLTEPLPLLLDTFRNEPTETSPPPPNNVLNQSTHASLWSATVATAEGARGTS